MKFLALIFTLFFSIATFAAPQAASNDFTSAQQTQIEKIIHDYLLKNPQILEEVAAKLQAQGEEQAKQQTRKAVDQYSNALFYSPGSPVLGNPKGSVTLVEFFDYQCPYCKRVTPMLTKLISTNPNLRVVLKEFPIFGETSDYASRAALAALLQNKYLPMHNALMQIKGHFSNTEQILAAAKAAGLDVDKLQKDMAKPEVFQELKTNMALANALGINATPAFIIAKTPAQGSAPEKGKTFFVPGGVDFKIMNELIAKAAA